MNVLFPVEPLINSFVLRVLGEKRRTGKFYIYCPSYTTQCCKVRIMQLTRPHVSTQVSLVDDGRMSSRYTWVVLGALLHLLLQGGVGAMSQLSMAGNGVRLLILSNRGRGADVMATHTVSPSSQYTEGIHHSVYYLSPTHTSHVCRHRSHVHTITWYFTYILTIILHTILL